MGAEANRFGHGAKQAVDVQRSVADRGKVGRRKQERVRSISGGLTKIAEWSTPVNSFQEILFYSYPLREPVIYSFPPKLIGATSGVTAKT